MWFSVDAITWSDVPLDDLATGTRAVAAMTVDGTVVVSRTPHGRRYRRPDDLSVPG